MHVTLDSSLVHVVGNLQKKVDINDISCRFFPNVYVSSGPFPYPGRYTASQINLSSNWPILAILFNSLHIFREECILGF